jgi:hypothetical protein
LAQKSDIDPTDLSPLNYRKRRRKHRSSQPLSGSGSLFVLARRLRGDVESASGGPDTPAGNHNIQHITLLDSKECFQQNLETTRSIAETNRLSIGHTTGITYAFAADRLKPAQDLGQRG